MWWKVNVDTGSYSLKHLQNWTAGYKYIRVCRWDFHNTKITVPRFVTDKVTLSSVGLLRTPKLPGHPPPIIKPPKLHVHSYIIQGWYNRTLSGLINKGAILFRKTGQEMFAQRMTGSLLYRSELVALLSVCQKMEPGAPDSLCFAET